MKISIILPCYKSEHYIANIIQDTLNQTYEDWELIIISNGPEQESQNKIINGFAEKDQRIFLFKTLTPGVSNARNLGMEKATGDWLIFIDADDRLLDNHLQTYITAISDPCNKDVDIIVSGYWRKSLDDIKPQPSPLIPFRGVDYSKISLHYTAIYSPCTKCIRISTLRKWGGRFTENFSCAEDGVFAFKLLNYTQNIVAIAINGYIYCETPGSAVGRYHENFHEATSVLNFEMVKLFSKYLNKAELQQFINNRKFYNNTSVIF